MYTHFPKLKQQRKHSSQYIEQKVFCGYLCKMWQEQTQHIAVIIPTFLLTMMKLPFSVCIQKDLSNLLFPILSEMLFKIGTKSFLRLEMSQSWWKFSVHIHKSLNKRRIQCTVTVSRQHKTTFKWRDFYRILFTTTNSTSVALISWEKEEFRFLA